MSQPQISRDKVSQVNYLGMETIGLGSLVSYLGMETIRLGN
jgi:hypothetical protein